MSSLFLSENYFTNFDVSLAVQPANKTDNTDHLKKIENIENSLSDLVRERRMLFIVHLIIDLISRMQIIFLFLIWCWTELKKELRRMN